MIEYSCSLSQLDNSLEKQLPRQQQTQLQQPVLGQQPREMQLQRDACAMQRYSLPPEQKSAAHLVSSSTLAPDHLQRSRALPIGPLTEEAISAPSQQTASQPLARSSSADWSLATEILLRKTRTECSRTLLRRHCSRQLHAVVLHWRLASVRSSFAADGGRDHCTNQDIGKGVGCSPDASGSSCDTTAMRAASKRCVAKRVTWDCKPAPPLSGEGDSGSIRNATDIASARVGHGRSDAAWKGGRSISLSAAWNANVTAAAAALTSDASACC
jgi:hypothetical protein